MRRAAGFGGLVCVLLFLASSCTQDRAGEWPEVPWNVVSPELSLRLIVPRTSMELGMRPTCVMEVMNTSGGTMLLDKSFSVNGPQVFTVAGDPRPQKKAVEVDALGGSSYHVLGPGEMVSVKAKPNYRMDEAGRYFLSFSIHPTWWGLEDADRLGKMVRRDETSGPVLTSNEVEVTVY